MTSLDLEKILIKEGIKTLLKKNLKENKSKNEDKNEEKKEKTFMKKYISVDNKDYEICFEETKKIIIISLINKDEDDSAFVSTYHLDYLNEKFGNTFQFKSIEEFRICLKNNVEKNKLVIKAPFRNAINTVWNIFPHDNKKNKSFTLISYQSWECNFSLFFYSNYKRAENIVNEIEGQIQIKPKQKNNKSNYLEQTYDKLIENIIFLDDQSDNKNNKGDIFKDIIKTNIEEREKRKIKFGNILIFFDDKNEINLFEDIMDIINNYYEKQIFIIIFSSGNTEDLKNKIFQKIDKLSQDLECCFDTNNVFIYKNESNDHKKILMALLKVFCYFNQLGDGFFKQLSDMDIKLENLENELKYLNNTHYFNILLCGRTGSGKSTFINTIIGEKKSLTVKDFAAVTCRNNYYIHKEYPIKIIDACGFIFGDETAEILELLKSIYNKDSNNIIIDNTNDSFSFYEDKRNYIHLLLYFNIFNDKYEVIPEELPIILEAIEKKIPIIFIVNKCPNSFFDNKYEKNITLKLIQAKRRLTVYGKYDTFFINCITKRGIDELFERILEEGEKIGKIRNYLIKDLFKYINY